jgi:hypothetical protein
MILPSLSAFLGLVFQLCAQVGAEPPLRFAVPQGEAASATAEPDATGTNQHNFSAAVGDEDAVAQPNEARPERLPIDSVGGGAGIDRLSSLDPAQPLYEALSAAAAGLQGRPTSLTEIIAAADPRQRLEVVHAYWRLACAMLDFQYRRAEADLLEHLAEQDSPELAAARAAAAARREEAWISVLEAQGQIAPLVHATMDQAPLAIDAPHAGPYRTKFELLFAAGSAPPRAWLLNQILPLRYREIEARRRAVEAARQAVEASEEAYRRGRIGLSDLLADVALLASVRRTMVASLRQYNDEIADYALGVVIPPTEIQTVAGMLIKPRASRAAAESDQVERAGFEVQRNSRGEATSGGARQETLPAEDSQPESEPSATAPVERGQTSILGAEALELLANTQLYQGLVGVEASARTERLVESLYAPAVLGLQAPTTSLLDALQSGHGRRLDLIADYWRASELDARRRVLDDVAVQIESLLPLAGAERASDKGGIVAVLRAAGHASRADLMATQIALADAQWRLCQALGRRVDQAWPLPATPPHGGMYRPLAGEIGSTTGETGLERIERLHRLLTAQSAAIVELDRARSEAIASFGAEGADVHRVLRLIAQQTDQTLAMLASVTRYNTAIAEYALAILPSNALPSLVESTLLPAQRANQSKS